MCIAQDVTKELDLSVVAGQFNDICQQNHHPSNVQLRLRSRLWQDNITERRRSYLCVRFAVTTDLSPGLTPLS